MAAKRARESVHELAEYAEATVRAAKRLTRAGSDDLEWAELKTCCREEGVGGSLER